MENPNARHWVGAEYYRQVLRERKEGEKSGCKYPSKIFLFFLCAFCVCLLFFDVTVLDIWLKIHNLVFLCIFTL